MNKKLFTILCIAIFLIAAVGFISAADDINEDVNSENDVMKVSSTEDVKLSSDLKNISVKIVWDDIGKSADRPTQVKVKLLKDDVVVDTVVLDEKNSWNATFENQSADGNYKVEMESDPEGYNASITGNPDIGFVITNKAADDKLGVSENQTDLKDANDTNVTDDDANTTNVTNDTNVTDDDANTTNVTNDTNVTDDALNTTDVKNDTADDDNVTDDDANTTDVKNDTADAANVTNNTIVVNNTNNTVNNINNTTNNTIVVNNASGDNSTKDNTVPVNKTVKKEQKDSKPLKKDNVNDRLKKVGIPIALLVLVIIIVVVVTYSRRKDN